MSQPMRILIVEDEELSRTVLSVMVSKFSECVTASDGQEAYDLFCEAHEGGNPFDLILLDIMMPGVNGQEALAAIRNFEESLSIPITDGVRVIMTTALDDAASIHTAHANGCTDYIVKPIERDALLRSIRNLGFSV